MKQYLPIMLASLFMMLSCAPEEVSSTKPQQNIIKEIILKQGVEVARSEFDRLFASEEQISVLDESTFNALGYELMNMGKIDEAVAVLEMVTRVRPDSSNLFDSLGEAYILNGDRELAQASYQKSLDLNPDNINARIVLNKLDSYIYDGANETREVTRYEAGESTNLQGDYLGQNPPGKTPEVFAPGIVSTRGGFEFSIAISPSGDEIYFNRHGDIMVCKQTEKGWTAPIVAEFNYPGLDHEPFFSSDGNTLYFGTMRPREGLDEGERPYGIHLMHRTENGWTVPEFFVKGMYISMTNDRTYFVTDIDNLAGGGIVYSRLENGEYGPLQRLGVEDENPSEDAHPWIAPDESYLLYDSDGLKVRFKQDDGSWSKEIPVTAFETEGDNMCPAVSPDGKYIFYHMKRDIYWVSASILDELRETVE